MKLWHIQLWDCGVFTSVSNLVLHVEPVSSFSPPIFVSSTKFAAHPNREPSRWTHHMFKLMTDCTECKHGSRGLIFFQGPLPLLSLIHFITPFTTPFLIARHACGYHLSNTLVISGSGNWCSLAVRPLLSPRPQKRHENIAGCKIKNDCYAGCLSHWLCKLVKCWGLHEMLLWKPIQKTFTLDSQPFASVQNCNILC